MRKIFLIFSFITVSLSTIAQKTKQQRKEERRQKINTLIKQDEEGVIAYHKHTIYGIKLNTDGYGAFLEIGRAKSIKKASLYQFEFSERKHPKDEKQSNPFVSAPPFIFGKINCVYDVKLGMQQQILLGNKSNKNGVSVSANFGGGINLALLRPYYVQVFDNNTNTLKYVKYDSPDSALFLNNSNFDIVGGPTFGKGWNELKFNPGVYVKGGFRFDYGKFNELVSALEAGLTVDLYSKKLDQMVYVKKRQFFFGAYIAIMFGKRK